MMRCPHCHQDTYGEYLDHFTSATKAREMGRDLCPRPGTRIARGDYWGFGCPAGHVCWAGPLPPTPDPDRAGK